jgi:transcriptional regulator of acetoin/glycerol metabolism
VAPWASARDSCPALGCDTCRATCAVLVLVRSLTMGLPTRDGCGVSTRPELRQEPLPIGRSAQRQVEAAWKGDVGSPSGSGPSASSGVLRQVIASSWRRSHAAGVAPQLAEAPLVLHGEALAEARVRSSWFGELAEVLAAQRDGYIGAQHMLAVFDAAGRMLHADGDPRALEQLARINFQPGALWSEAAVGTNGPGTALALGRAVHVIGAEHFCERWQAWHCASVPVRDPESGALLGVIDLSGHRDAAHPYALTLATAITVALEQRLAAREGERRAALLLSYAQLAARYPGDTVLAIDRFGRVLVDSVDGGRESRRLTALGDEGRRRLAELVGSGCGGVEQPRDVTEPQLGLPRAVLHPVWHGRSVVAGCLVVPRRALSGPPAARRLVTRIRASGVRYHLADLIGDAPAMQGVRRLARACARTDLPVLLRGESGTGKEVLAQAIHDESPRRAGPFVAVNCAALPRDLMESELFGHAAGAFTGALREGTVGKFQAADGGTLFLDEVAELGPEAQASLLRVLQEGEVTRLGEHIARTVDVRVIAATNRDVVAAVASGRLRDDLYHRLDVLGIELPPLRERREDIPQLVQRFLATAPACGDWRISSRVADAFARYEWPGNVRELQNVVHRMVALAESMMLDVDDLPVALRALAPVSDASATSADATASTTSAARGLRQEPVVAAAAAGASAPHDRARAELEAVVARHPTMVAAAAALGITRSTLYRRLERHGLAPGRSVRATGTPEEPARAFHQRAGAREG